MLAALLCSPVVLAADSHVTVYFVNECPEKGQAVYEPTVKANGSDKVIWHAVDRASNQPVTTGYKIYFDPFKDGKPLQDKDKDGVAFIAMKDSGVADSGNIYFGDPVFGTLQAMQSFMYAENNFYDLNLDSSGSQNVDLYGNMSAGNQVLVQRDYFGSHTKLSVEFDDRLKDGSLQIPGLPGGGSSGKSYSVTYWNQIATQ